MKQIITLLVLLPLILNARIYNFSGAEDHTIMYIASSVLQKAYTRAGIETQFVFLPLEVSLKRSNSGEDDGEIARIKNITLLYPNLRQVPVEITAVEAVAFSKSTSLNIKNWSDLYGHKVTVIKGVKFIEQSTKNIPREFKPTFAEAFEALENGNTEIVIAPKLTGKSVLYKENYNQIKVVSPTLKRLPLYHFVHKKNSHLIPIIIPVLKKMKESGEIDYIHQAYLRTITH